MKHILIIDDEEDIRILMRAMLRSAGYEVDCASNIELAQNLLEVGKYQTIFLDLNLGNDYGLNLLPRISETQDDAEVVVITAYDEPSIRRQVQEEGITHFVPKPFKKSQILEMVA